MNEPKNTGSSKTYVVEAGNVATTSDQKFLSSRLQFNPKNPAVIALVLAVIATVAIVRAANVSTVEESVKLSNGVEIRLGQSTKELTKALRGNLHKVNDQFYQYPANRFKPVEALIYAKSGKLTVIQIIGGAANRHTATGAKVGVKPQELSPKVQRSLKPLDYRLVQLRRRGKQVNQSRSVAYLITAPCVNTDKVASMTLALKTATNTLTDRALPTDCTEEKE